jgi:uncharacterized membrane protein
MPYLSTPDLQFGIRVPYNFSKQPEFLHLRRQYTILVALLQAIVLTIYVVFFSRIPGLFETFMPILIVPIGFFGYFRARRKTLRLRGHYKQSEHSGGKIIAYMVRDPIRWAPIWFVLPWIELSVFIAIGVLYYPHIPNILATHYGAGGQPNRFSVKSYLTVFELLILVYLPSLILLEAFAMAVLRVLPNRNSRTPRKAGMQMRGFNKAMYQLFIIIACILGLSMFLDSAKEWGLLSGLPIIITTIPVIVIVPLVLLFTVRTGQTGWKLYPGAVEKPNEEQVVDDDQYWTGGLVYHNKEDESLLVPKRYGLGYTFNFGKRFVWILIGIVIATPLIVITLVIIHVL